MPKAKAGGRKKGYEETSEEAIQVATERILRQMASMSQSSQGRIRDREDGGWAPEFAMENEMEHEEDGMSEFNCDWEAVAAASAQPKRMPQSK